ncbi:hypothetical protein PHAVU_006G139800 [Phaseolus vulgaris]|uniref:Uncharacterized protein n=1 Tax=Phaseolus vulgaris TaxID=3885 RepID=V7BNQ8_PHAVU|nr:hypothetical protein PHAVU_006G139800g [Phaseolus vulgaris]ESW19612.1 hypothetical protein PHAVU_006G139800g [Phaseolus vulgaris]
MSSCKRGWGQVLLIVTTVSLVTRALWESAIILLTLFRYFHATVASILLGNNRNKKQKDNKLRKLKFKAFHTFTLL